MDAKEIKLTLKGIKENLDARDFKSAIKQCKSILKSDRNNYFALVFFGVALQETEQKDEAPKAFKKAIEIKPDNNLAWRGIASYYQKFECPENNHNLLKAYQKLIILETESNKYEEFIKKYEILAVKMRDSAYSKELYTSLGGFSEEKKRLLKQSLLKIFSNLGSDSDSEIFEYRKNLLEELALTESYFQVESHSMICKQFLEFLYKEGKLTDVINNGNKFQIIYPTEHSIVEYICKAYAELFCHSDNSLNEFSPENAYSLLFENNPNSYLGFLCEGIHMLHNGDPVNALDALKQSVKEESSFGLSWFVLCKCQILLYHFIDSELSAQEALKCFTKKSKTGEFIQNIEFWLIQSLSEQESEDKWLKAVDLGCAFYQKVSEDKKILPYVIKALLKLNRITESENYLDILMKDEKYLTSVKYLKCLMLKKTGELLELKKNLEELIKENSEYFEAWLELGKLYYYEENGPSCLSYLLKAAKLNPFCYLNFLFLGHCYKDLLNDLDKARRCYQKAFQLNPECSETGHCLSDLYRALGKEDLNGQLLSVITTQKPKSKWGWLNLGIHYLSLKQYQDAVNSLRLATRLEPNNRMTWEVLADAYFYQGAYTSAAKSYNKAIELGSDSIYPLLQIAIVKHHIGQHVASVLSFKEIIDKNPYYIPALKSHAEACLSLMKQYLSQNLNGLAMDKCQEAIHSLISCLETRKDFACIWKLLGDACVLLSNLPEKYCKLSVPSRFVKEHMKEEKDLLLKKVDILKLGSKGYCEALSLNSNSSSLWYDLAVCYNCLATCGSYIENKKEMRKLACSSIKKSILVNEKSWESWNLFGIIAASDEIQDFPLAQHCFIRALEENDTSSLIWTNLGTLYLYLGDLKLANQSFTEAQRFDHDYVQCWIGQAIIAYKTGHHDALDLFRHSNQLGVHPESSLGYANLVCQTLLNTKDKNDRNYTYSIKNMNAITVACDALTWYTDRIGDNSCAFNMLGLLLERQKLYDQSCKAFHNAVSLLLSSESNKVSGWEADDHAEILDKALLNYGRSLANIGKPQEAITVLKQIRKANFINQCALAEAYFQAKKYEEAYSSYETTLEWLAPDSGFKSHILVAMAAVVYMHQGKEDATILLMQASQLKPPSVQGLFACCALGMLHSDLSLSELSLKELSQYKDDPKYLNHIAVFESYIYLFKGEKKKAVRALSKVIHRHPQQPSLWLSMSLLLLYLYPSFDSQIAANSAEVTIKIGRSSIDISKVMSLVSLSNLLSGKGLKSLRSAQKAVHMFPHETENWVVLVASVLSKCLVKETEREISWLKGTISYIRRKLGGSKAMAQWLSNNERKVTLMTDRVES